MRYYSIQRPVAPGAYPSGYPVLEIHNFDRKTFCEEIGRDAWGYIDFAEALPAGEIERYELRTAGVKRFWCVTSSFNDRGRVTAAITRIVDAAEIPENSSISTKRKDIYCDWFDSREAALKYIEEAKNA